MYAVQFENIANQGFDYKVQCNSRCTDGVLSPVGLPGGGDDWPEL